SVCAAWNRPACRPVDPAQRLPGDSGRHPGHRGALPRDQSRCRPLLSPARPARGAPVNRGGIAFLLAPFLARPITMAGLGVLVAMVLAAIFAPLLAPYDPYAIDPLIRLTPPDAVHWFGTDQYGRDTLSR